MSRREDLAWAAGVIDGEGCISLTRRSPQTSRQVNCNYRLILKVTMCHKPTIARLRKIFGCGTLHKQKAQQSYWTDSWVWFCNATDAGACLRLLREFLLTKAKEADVALQFLALPRSPRGGRGGSPQLTAAAVQVRDKFYLKLRNMKGANVSKDKRAALKNKNNKEAGLV
jgi:hypothetical protein